MKLVMKTLQQLTMKKEIRELKESIRMMKSQRSNLERNKLIEDGKRIGIEEIISLKYKTMLHIIIWSVKKI